MIEQELADYIRTELAYDRTEALSFDESLLNGVLDSVDVLRLVVYVEEHYSVVIDDDDLVPENFETITALAQLLHQKHGEV